VSVVGANTKRLSSTRIATGIRSEVLQGRRIRMGRNANMMPFIDSMLHSDELDFAGTPLHFKQGGSFTENTTQP